jgi:hypothetical protein
MKLLLPMGPVAWLAVSMAVAGALAADPGPARGTSIASGRLRVEFDAASGRLRMQSGGREFAVAQFAGPGRAVATVEKVGPGTTFGPGWMLKIQASAIGILPVSEDRVLVREGSPWVLIRRDGSAVPATPGNRVEALEAALDLGVDAANRPLKLLGPAGLSDLAKNPGQHVVTAIADPASGAGVVAGLVRIDAASGVLLTRP